jgi:exonuclease SbcC
MRLISLELKNIRSYRYSKVGFPDGITILSGDIGAGKSTLLLAIEFALFGISRGELVGSALLRHGTSDGIVVLSFSVHKHQYTVSRSLKRSAAGITQDTGWIETDGVRETLTPSELRARIYEILGYPLQFLGKQRNLLYRFTIYTPQEEMKAILTQSSEERLETIRRIFGIDAYRVARDNAHLLAKALKEREGQNEALLGRVRQDIERTAARLEHEDALRKQKALLGQERGKLAAAVDTAEAAAAKIEADRAKLEQKQQAQVMQERNRKIAEAELGRMRMELERKERALRDAQGTVEKLRQALELFTNEAVAGGAVPQDAVPHDASAVQEQLAAAQQQIEQLKTEEGRVLGIIEQCNHSPNVAAGTVCPTCKQSVSQEHLEQVKALLLAQKAAAQKRQEKVHERQAAQRAVIDRLQAQLELLRRIDDVRTRLGLQETTVAGFREDAARIAELVASKQQALGQMQVTADATLPEQMRAAGQRLLEARSVLQRHKAQLLDAERMLARIEQELKAMQEAREQLVALRAEEAQLVLRLDADSQVRGWITRQFTPFTATVERHVLMSIHASFDAVFRQWFSRLIEDDGLATRIDHEFAPIMMQYGYETDVAFLSGGERTAVSLAYRLSLVHTIHVLSPHLGTSGLIMLDEPTEGFSSEQLERVRDVLRDIRMDQIILVSHEQQLEGFVDHILRVRKSGDGSIVEVAA